MTSTSSGEVQDHATRDGEEADSERGQGREHREGGREWVPGGGGAGGRERRKDGRGLGPWRTRPPRRPGGSRVGWSGVRLGGRPGVQKGEVGWKGEGEGETESERGEEEKSERKY